MSIDTRRGIWVGAQEAQEGSPRTPMSQFYRMFPFNDFQPTPNQKLLRVKEKKMTRVMDGKSARAKKNEAMSLKSNTRYDLNAWPHLSLFGQPTSALASGSTGADSIQAVIFAGMPSAGGGFFYLNVNGYWTQAIAYDGATAQNTANNAAFALANIPSVNGLNNVSCAISGTLGAQTLTITFKGSLAKFAMPTIQCAAFTATAAATATVFNDGTNGSVVGLGTYQHDIIGGLSGMPTQPFAWFDGVAVQQGVGGSVTDWAASLNTDGFLGSDYNIISRFEVPGAPSYPIMPAVQVVAGAVTAGSNVAVTPPLLANITVGTILHCLNAAGTNGESVAVTAVNPLVYTLNRNSGTGGKVGFGYRGASSSQTTLDASTTAASLQTSINAITTIVAGATVTGSNGGPFTITLPTGFTDTLILQLTGTFTGGTPSMVCGTFTATFGSNKAVNWLLQAPATVSLVPAALTATGVQTITPISSMGVVPNQLLWVANVDGTFAESVPVSAFTNTYTVALGAATAGTFTLTVGNQTTATIVWNAAASAVQAALVLLSTVGAGGATVSGPAIGPYVVTLASGTIGALIGSGAGLTGGTFAITNPAGLPTWNVSIGTTADPAGSFTLTYGGVTTAGIAAAASNATVQTALTGLASIGTGNATVTGSSANTYNVLLAPGLVGPLTGSGASLTAGGLSIGNNTTFTAIFQQTHTAGWKILPPLSIPVVGALSALSLGVQTLTPGAMTAIISQGLIQCCNGDGTSAETLFVQALPSATTFIADISLTKFANWVIVPAQLPAFVESNYSQPVDPLSFSCTLNGVTFAQSESVKWTYKGVRDPKWVLGQQNTDMITANEGETTFDLELTARYILYVGTLYQNFVNNQSPGTIVLKVSDPANQLQGGYNPSIQLTATAPFLETLKPDIGKAESQIDVKGYAALDPATLTNVSVRIINQVKFYTGVPHLASGALSPI